MRWGCDHKYLLSIVVLLIEALSNSKRLLTIADAIFDLNLCNELVDEGEKKIHKRLCAWDCGMVQTLDIRHTTTRDRLQYSGAANGTLFLRLEAFFFLLAEQTASYAGWNKTFAVTGFYYIQVYLHNLKNHAWQIASTLLWLAALIHRGGAGSVRNEEVSTF